MALIVRLQGISGEDLNRASVCAWLEHLREEERKEEEQKTPDFEEIVSVILSMLVSNLPELDRAVVERAFGFNGVEAVVDVGIICTEQDLNPAELTIILKRSCRALLERLVLIHLQAKNRVSVFHLASTRLSVD